MCLQSRNQINPSHNKICRHDHFSPTHVNGGTAILISQCFRSTSNEHLTRFKTRSSPCFCRIFLKKTHHHRSIIPEIPPKQTISVKALHDFLNPHTTLSLSPVIPRGNTIDHILFNSPTLVLLNRKNT